MPQHVEKLLMIKWWPSRCQFCLHKCDEYRGTNASHVFIHRFYTKHLEDVPTSLPAFLEHTFSLTLKTPPILNSLNKPSEIVQMLAGLWLVFSISMQNVDAQIHINFKTGNNNGMCHAQTNLLELLSESRVQVWYEGWI